MKKHTEEASLTECVDNILALAFQTDRKLKESEQDAACPGVMGRVAQQTAQRARRKSREIEQRFHDTMAERLESVFRRFDADESGFLDASELKAAFEAAGRPTDDETINQSIAALDTNNDGVINLDEFKAIAWKCAMGA